MNVLSLFDGMSCGQIALERAGIDVENYYACEIKKNAINVTLDNYPNTIHLGDIRSICIGDIPNDIELLIGGSPCQNLSIANNSREGLSGEKSSLFFEYARILKDLQRSNNDVKFLLENVVMEAEERDCISKILGVQPIYIDSLDFTFQMRKRLYWTNIDISEWVPKKTSFQDYKSTNYDYCKEFKVNNTPSRIKMWEGKCPNVTHRDSICCITRKQDRWGNAGLVEFDGFCRYLTTNELESAQTVPLGYCRSLSKNQASDVLGDGWTVDVIAHIFKGLH